MLSLRHEMSERVSQWPTRLYMGRQGQAIPGPIWKLAVNRTQLGQCSCAFLHSYALYDPFSIRSSFSCTYLFCTHMYFMTHSVSVLHSGVRILSLVNNVLFSLPSARLVTRERSSLACEQSGLLRCANCNSYLVRDVSQVKRKRLNWGCSTKDHRVTVIMMNLIITKRRRRRWMVMNENQQQWLS